MSSVLRFARSFGVRSFNARFAADVRSRLRDLSGNHFGVARCLALGQPRHCVTRASQRRANESNSRLQPLEQKNNDQALFKLDLDVRRMGRIPFRSVQEVFNSIKASGSATSTQSLLLIRCCGSLLPEEHPTARTKFADEVWNALISMNAPLDVSHYNALLKIHLENDTKFSPTDFVAKMEAKGVQPNRVTYQRLISYYCQLGDLDGASNLLEFMKQKDLPINENVFNSLILGHARAGDMAGAKGILEVMRNATLEPSADTYATLMRCHGEKGDVKAILETLQEASKNDIFLLDRDLLDVILALATHGHTQHVDELFVHLRKLVGYNQDAMNAILRLVVHDRVDVAYKLLFTMPRQSSEGGEPVATGFFFVRQLVKVGHPPAKVLEYCADLKEKGLNDSGVVKAAEIALQTARPDDALTYIRAMRLQGLPVRPHYFWPVLVALKDDGSRIFDTLREMQALDCPANFDTFVDYVYPALDLRDPDVLIQRLRELGYPVGTVVNPLVNVLVHRDDLSTAADLARKYPVRLTPVPLLKTLAGACFETRDFGNALDLLAKIHETRDTEVKSDWTGRFVLEFLALCNHRADGLKPLLEGLMGRDLKLSHATVDTIHGRLQGDVPELVASLLESLGTTTLSLAPEDSEPGGIPHPREMSAEELEGHLLELRSKSMNTRGVLRRLLLVHCRGRNLPRVLEIKAELDSTKFVYSPAMYAQLMDVHVAHDKLEEALSYWRLLEDSDFPVDDHKVINLASLLAKVDRVDEAERLISDHHRKFGAREKQPPSDRNVWRLLNARAEKGDTEGTRRLFDLISRCGFVEMSNAIVGCLVKSHLARDDLEGALREFEAACKTTKRTPWKNELFQRLIKTEDAERLQKMVDLSNEVHGEMNTLYDLALAFLEAGQLKQARKILETPGLRARHQRLDTICDRYLSDNKVAELEGLVGITRDLFDIDRDRMYFYLLRAYTKNGDVDKALGVWTSMQEENVQPSDHTLIYLANLLEREKRPIPFAVPAPAPLGATSDARQKSDVLAAMLRADNVDGALEAKKNLEAANKELTVVQMSDIVRLMLRKERVTEAVSLTNEMLSKGCYPLPRVLQLLLVKMARAGDLEEMKHLGKSIPIGVLAAVNYDNLVINAHINSGRGLEAFDELEKKFQEYRTNFPTGGFLGILTSHSEVLDRAEKLARNHATQGFHSTLNMVWIHHMINENYDAADAIFKETPVFQQRLMFANVVRKIREKHNETMARKLVDVVASTNLNSRTKGITYSCLVDVLCLANRMDDALREMENAKSSGLSITDYNRTTLLRIKSELEVMGKPVPFEIPAESKFTSNHEDSSSSSSDSSDDEKH